MSARPNKASAEDVQRQRRAARLAAVQALYEQDMTGVSTETVLRDFLENRWERLDTDGKATEPAIEIEFRRGLFGDLVRGVSARVASLDEILDAALAPARKVERLEAVLRAILRTGCYELTSKAAVPARVIITEYVAIADGFFSGKEPGLVNGVLDRIAHTVRSEELEARKDGGKG